MPPAKMLATVSAKNAVVVPPGCPYSIATNVAHAEVWQRLWLARLQGLRRPKIWKEEPDFPVVPPERWPEVRQAFLDGLETALRIAGAEPFAHQMESDEAAYRTLNQIAVHGAYHVGQIRLLKRILREHKQRRLSDASSS